MPRTYNKRQNVTQKTQENKQEMQENEIDYKAKAEELEAKLNSLMSMLEKQNAERPQAQTVSVEDKYHRRILVTNISDWGVTLKTSNEGNATQFRLDRFGSTLPISYEDLNKCINTDMRLFTEGYVYINDRDAVQDNYLESYYEKFLDNKTISNIMQFSENELVDMVTNTTPTIQRTICAQIARKMLQNEYVDMNKAHIIGKACTPPIDIFELSKKLG